MKRLILPVILIAALTLITVTGCSNKSTTETAFETVENTTQSEKETKADAEGILVQHTADGEHKISGSTGLSLPEGYPEDIVPLIEKEKGHLVMGSGDIGAKLTNFTVLYQAPVEFDKAVDFYTSLPNLQVTKTTNIPGMSVIEGMIGEYTVKIALRLPQKEGSPQETTININLSKKN